ncbi:MAG: YdcF family protein [Flavobacteriales bacterium]|nr:YdcF family protein [Flavobacteriales bacterium]
MTLFSGRRLAWIIAGLVLAVVLWWCRAPILRAFGGFLIRADAPCHGDAMYVLGGAALERAIAAETLYREGTAPVVIFTGGVMPEVLRINGVHRTEAAVCRNAAVLAGLPPDRAELLEIGTSTREEAFAVRDQALARGYDTVVVVTTEFHTRRVGNVFRETLEPVGIVVRVRAAYSHRYSAARWWQSEDGMLMVNNEYMKLVYYAITY